MTDEDAIATIRQLLSQLGPEKRLEAVSLLCAECGHYGQGASACRECAVEADAGECPGCLCEYEDCICDDVEDDDDSWDDDLCTRCGEEHMDCTCNEEEE